jgi:hypothetical protein
VTDLVTCVTDRNVTGAETPVTKFDRSHQLRNRVELRQKSRVAERPTPLADANSGPVAQAGMLPQSVLRSSDAAAPTL